jgi:hypothetical protein
VPCAVYLLGLSSIGNRQQHRTYLLHVCSIGAAPGGPGWYILALLSDAIRLAQDIYVKKKADI